MNEFVEKNKRLLQVYCVVARIAGWVLLLWATAWIVWVLLQNYIFIAGGIQEPATFVVSRQVFTIMQGFMALGVAQFMKYLFDSKYHPGWILRYGDKILYIYVVLQIAYVVWIYGSFYTVIRPDKTNFEAYEHLHLYTMLQMVRIVLPTAVKALILIGVAQILKRLMPVIEESRTLV